MPGGPAQRLRAPVLAVVAAGLGIGLGPAAPAGAGVVPGGAIDGPSADIVGLGGVAMAADGGGAVAYLRRDGGVPHVFVAVLTDGTWAPPIRVDAGLPGPAAQPVVGAASGGRVAVAFLSGGALYASVRPGSGARAAFTPPQVLASGALDPTLAMGISGTAYVAYAAATGELRAARLDRTATAFAGLPDALDARPPGTGGTGPALRARIAVSADATGLVGWGVDGPDGRTHVLLRRVFGLHVGSVVADATLDQLGGRAGGSADLADVGIQDDSSYGWIAFRETFAGPGGTPSPRAIVRPLVGSGLGAPATIDGLGEAGGAGAGGPSLAIDGAGDGLVATPLAGGTTVGGAATGPGGFGPGQPIGGTDPGGPPPVAAVSRTGQGLIAYPSGQGGLAARLFDAGQAVGGEVQLGRADYGPVYLPGGLSAAADARGDALVAYLQGDDATRRVAVAAVVDPPGPFYGLTTDHTVRSARPVLQWTASRRGFSPVTYTVLIDGRPIGTTSATSFPVPAPLSDGLHRWQSVARDSLGQQTASAVRALRIAARPPVVTLTVAGSRRVGATLRLTVGARSAAGVGRVLVDFGDGSRTTGSSSRHRYARAGRFTVVVTVIDRAGNRAVVRRAIGIAK